MSEYFLVVIPREPLAELPSTAADLRNALASVADTNEARIKDYGKLQFIDCGKNFSRLSCPVCQSEIPLEQWQIWMNEDWHGEEGFHLHRHQTPCCGADVTLNSLSYERPQGFARWFVGARHNGLGALNPSEVMYLEQVAGLPLKAIAQRY